MFAALSDKEKTMKYDRWADQKKQIAEGFDAWQQATFDAEQTGASPQMLEWLRDAWEWSAIGALQTAASLAERTYEGSQSGEDGDSGYDYHAENTANALREIAEDLAKTTEPPNE